MIAAVTVSCIVRSLAVVWFTGSWRGLTMPIDRLTSALWNGSQAETEGEPRRMTLCRIHRQSAIGCVVPLDCAKDEPLRRVNLTTGGPDTIATITRESLSLSVLQSKRVARTASYSMTTIDLTPRMPSAMLWITELVNPSRPTSARHTLFTSGHCKWYATRATSSPRCGRRRQPICHHAGKPHFE